RRISQLLGDLHQVAFRPEFQPFDHVRAGRAHAGPVCTASGYVRNQPALGLAWSLSAALPPAIERLVDPLPLEQRTDIIFGELRLDTRPILRALLAILARDALHPLARDRAGDNLTSLHHVRMLARGHPHRHPV